MKRTVCTYRSVGCSIDAVVQDGVWIRQEPVFDSRSTWARTAPQRGDHEHGIAHDSHRLKPDEAPGRRGRRLAGTRPTTRFRRCPTSARKGPRRVVRGRSSSTTTSRLSCCAGSFPPLGTNNTDHQAHLPLHHRRRRRPDLGLRRDDNSYNDEQNSVATSFASNAAERPVSMRHTLNAKESGCKVIVADPRFTPPCWPTCTCACPAATSHSVRRPLPRVRTAGWTRSASAPASTAWTR